MAYKHVEIISGYSVPGRGLIFLTLARDIKPGEVVEINGKVWKVHSVECSDIAPHAGLVVSPYTESEEKQATAREAKNILEAICGGADTTVAPVVAPAIKALSPDEQKVKLVQVLNEMNSKINDVKDWSINKLSEFDLGKEPPAVLLLAVTMPQSGMEAFVQQLEKFLVSSVEGLEKSGKLAWANVKAVAGVK